jgi:hypothetical protein
MSIQIYEGYFGDFAATSYIAGLVDGEGYMGLYLPHGVMVGVEMYDKQSLEFLVGRIGGNVRAVKSRGRHRGGYRVSYSSNSAITVLEILKDYLILAIRQTV